MTEFLWWFVVLFCGTAALCLLVVFAVGMLIAVRETARALGTHWKARRRACEVCLRVVRRRDQRGHQAACQLLAGVARTKVEELLDDLGVSHEREPGSSRPRWREAPEAADRWIRHARRAEPAR